MNDVYAAVDFSWGTADDELPGRHTGWSIMKGEAEIAVRRQGDRGQRICGQLSPPLFVHTSCRKASSRFQALTFLLD